MSKSCSNFIWFRIICIFTWRRCIFIWYHYQYRFCYTLEPAWSSDHPATSRGLLGTEDLIARNNYNNFHDFHLNRCIYRAFSHEISRWNNITDIRVVCSRYTSRRLISGTKYVNVDDGESFDLALLRKIFFFAALSR